MIARVLLLVATAVALVACAATAAPVSTSPSLATAAPAPSLGIRVAILPGTRYGAALVETIPGAACALEVRVPPSQFGGAPPPQVTGTADASGRATFAYSAPRRASGAGEHRVSCMAGGIVGSAAEPFTVAAAPISAAQLSVRVVAGTPTPAAADGATLDASLTPLRDASADAMVRTLAREWRAATRGLGELIVADASEDIRITVVAGRGTSAHLRGSDGSEEIVVFVAGDIGTRTVENNVAVALHELGHIWCCTGPDADDKGHWREQRESPGLFGVDRYGLMNHPVTCTLFPNGVLSCPNRFSDRELLAMGFRDIPPPAADPCITQQSALKAELERLDGSLAATAAEIDAVNATIAQLAQRIRSLEQQYAGGMPPDVYRTYTGLIEQHNALVAQNRSRVSEHNATLARRNEVARQSNALPC